jgi:hypothetical protein
MGAVLAALVADAAIVAIDRVRGPSARGRLPTAAAIALGLLWAGQLAGLAATIGVAWPPELWGGAIMLSAGSGAALGVLAAPAARSAATREASQSPMMSGSTTTT